MKKLFIILLLFISCKPPVPTVKEYGDKSGACFLADKCMVLNSYTEVKQDCSVLIQKCMKYVDYEKCGDDRECYSRVQVTY